MASIGQGDRSRRRPAEGHRARALRRRISDTRCWCTRCWCRARSAPARSPASTWRRRRRCRRAGDHHAGQRAEAGDEGRRAADGACAAAAGQGRSLQRPARRRGGGARRWSRRTPPRRRCACSYRRDEPVTSMDAVLGQAYAPKNFRNGERPPDSRRGDPDAAFDGAAAKVDATYITPIEHHNPMEPHATIARWDGDRLTVWTATQGISGAQQTLAGLFGIAPSRCPRDLPLCRRRLRLQGQHLAAGDTCRDGGEGRRQAGEAGGDARADVHLERLSSAHRAEAALRRGRPRPSGVDAARRLLADVAAGARRIRRAGRVWRPRCCTPVRTSR